MSSLVDRDLAVLWHPATHFRDQSRLPPLPIERAEGVWLHPPTGQPVLDAISSWWTCLHGHGHPALRDALVDQVERLDHVMLAGFSHEPAVALAEALLARAPGGGGARYLAPADDLSGVVAADTHAADVAARSTAADRGRRSY